MNNPVRAPRFFHAEHTVVSMQVSRKSNYRLFVAHHLPQIQILDEQLINEDDRLRAEVYYTDTSVGGRLVRG